MEEREVSDRLARIEEDLLALTQRNQKVELEKSWETSLTRMAAIVVITYILMCLIFSIIGVQEYFKNAIIPTLGYLLSTQSLPAVKRYWLKFRK